MSRISPFMLIILLIMTLIIMSFVLFEGTSAHIIDETAAQISSSQWKLPGLAAFMMLVLTLDVVLPIPSSLVAVYIGTTFGFLGGAFVIWMGLTGGALFGYWLGRGCKKVLPKKWAGEDNLEKASVVSESLDSAALVLMRGIPVLAETSVIAAGMKRYPLVQFLMVTSLANAGIAVVYGWVGSQVMDEQSLFLIIAASLAVPMAALLLKLAVDGTMGRGKLDLYPLFGSKKSGVMGYLPSLDKDIVNSEEQDSNNTLQAKFQVDYGYPIISTRDAFTPQNLTLADLLCNQSGAHGTQKIFCVIDENLMPSRPDLTKQIKQYFQQTISPKTQCQYEVITGGEAGKTQHQVNTLIAKMADFGLDRHNHVIAIGGGAVLDTVGFACGIFHRGIRLIRMPSTVLAQNDAGVGVKNGINLLGHKNFVGTFATPSAVVNDSAWLSSLSDRDKRAGLAEAVKVSLIKDGAFFIWLEKHAEQLAKFEPTISEQAIWRCAKCHIEHICQSGDPFERGNGRPLDFGHWSAHKLENLSDYALRHGEAVAVGICLDTLYARELGWITQTECQRIITLMQNLGFALWHPKVVSKQNSQFELLRGLEDFRQHLGGELSIPVLTTIGEFRNVSVIDDTKMQRAIIKLTEMVGQTGQVQ